jgi:hypothetical protein
MVEAERLWGKGAKEAALQVSLRALARVDKGLDQCDDVAGRYHGRVRTGVLLEELGEFELALEQHSAALALAETEGHLDMQSDSLNNIAWLYLRRGEFLQSSQRT